MPTLVNLTPNLPWMPLQFDLVGEVVSLGRHPDFDVCVPAHMMPRLQLRFHREPEDGYSVESCTIHGYVAVNGKRVPMGERVSLRDGDTIRVLDYHLLYRSQNAQPRKFPWERVRGIDVFRLRDRFDGCCPISWSDIEPEVWQSEIVSTVDRLPDPPWVVLDVAEVEFITSGRLGRMIALVRVVRSRGGELVVSAMSSEIASLVAGIFRHPAGDELLPRAISLDDAVARLVALKLVP